ncbi:hypothetical protein [Cellulomonas sp. PhB150]|uniref:hypothetical protein n=1 Tax=Cellulomonas sp. PhB150 TaxID=2485188 RepID=UPI000F47FECC|nr:hypothetical protein [Cellulomonas sp. PhB150]ROS26221.1 hypothetical protein EDF34_2552 [Cellulomonas sp. PhB150]
MMRLAPDPGSAPPELWTDDWWSTFLTSPAVAGFAALLAAVIGIYVARGRARTDSDLARDQRTESQRAALDARRAAVDDARAARWWQMYQWTLDRIDVLDPDRVQILLEALEKQAPGDPERALVSVAGDLLVSPGAEDGETDGG